MFEAIHSGVAPRDENNGLKLPTTAEERTSLGRFQFYYQSIECLELHIILQAVLMFPMCSVYRASARGKKRKEKIPVSPLQT